MGNRILEWTQDPGESRGDLERRLQKALKVRGPWTWRILLQSLDARRQDQIHWKTRILVSSPDLRGEDHQEPLPLAIPHPPSPLTAVVLGAGPAGLFASLLLIRSGCRVTLIEQGSRVPERARAIETFERTQELNPRNHYAFGEGGAGTFSDGKLTARSKHIRQERDWILQNLIACGAPEEIAWRQHPHIGSDHLAQLIPTLRRQLEAEGVRFLFDTRMTGLEHHNQRVTGVKTEAGSLPADLVLLAPGQSDHDTYRLLLQAGLPFQAKPFALGVRIEHPQTQVNRWQWGRETVPGLKAAEYRYTLSRDLPLPVFSFCMCPGGRVVPATARIGRSVVNGMSAYPRGGAMANAAWVASGDPAALACPGTDPGTILDALDRLEARFFELNQSYAVPATTVEGFVRGQVQPFSQDSSFPFPLIPHTFSGLLPATAHQALQQGLDWMMRHLPGFGSGTVLGLESKTSAPIQGIRSASGQVEGWEGLFLCGEGSGHAGGIISSAADACKVLLAELDRRSSSR